MAFQQLLCLPYTRTNEQSRYNVKDHQVAIALYHLVCTQINNSGHGGSALHVRLPASIHPIVVTNE